MPSTCYYIGNDSSRESDSSEERNDSELAEHHNGKRKCVPNIEGGEYYNEF